MVQVVGRGVSNSGGLSPAEAMRRDLTMTTPNSEQAIKHSE